MLLHKGVIYGMALENDPPHPSLIGRSAFGRLVWVIAGTVLLWAAIGWAVLLP
jgi:hypothetical protein